SFYYRKAKNTISRYHAHTDTARPLASTSITAIDVTICQPAAPTPRQAPKTKTHHHRQAKPTNRSTPPAAPIVATQPPGRRAAVWPILHSTPGQAWKARDIARNLGVTSETALNSFCVQMSQWARRGLLIKTGPARYMIA